MRWGFYKNFLLPFSVLSHIIHSWGLVFCFSPTDVKKKKNKNKKTAPGWKSLTLGKKWHSEILKMYISRQSNLQIQCNCYQNSNRMFPINRTNNLKNLHGTTKTTLNSQNKLDKERCRRHHTPWSQTNFKVIAIKMVWYLHCCSVTQSFPTLCDPTDATRQASLSFIISWSVPKFMSIASWYHLAISSSEAIFSFCPQSFLASGTFPMSELFASDDQNTRASTSASVLPMSI